MMYRSAIIIVVISLFFGTCSLDFKRGNGNMETSEFEIESFRKIYVGGNYELKMIPAKVCRVVIETDENLLRYINVEQHEETLNINNVHNLKSSRGIFIEVYYTALEQIYSTGTSKIGHEGVIEAGELRINLSGAGAIDLDIETVRVQVEMSGAGVIILSGNTEIQEAHISGAGGLMAEKLQSKECDIHLGGIGGANVYVTEKLEASITGIGGIQYSGNPQLIEKRITGLGKIVRNEEFIDNELSEELP
jgi:hypothetical protein